MATVSTDAPYFWYIRRGPRVNTIGVVVQSGEAVDSDLTVEIRGGIVDESQSFENDATLELPSKSILPFMKGVASTMAEVLTGKADTLYEGAFQDEKTRLRGRNRAQRNAGAGRIMPKNLRSDRARYKYTRSDNA